jgi:hypothetical protein
METAIVTRQFDGFIEQFPTVRRDQVIQLLTTLQ